MKLINVSEIINLQAMARGVIAVALNEIVANPDHKAVLPFTQVLSLDGHQIRAEYAPIYGSHIQHAGHSIPHTCGKDGYVGELTLMLPTGAKFPIRFEEEDFGKPVPDDQIDGITEEFIYHLRHAAVDQYLIKSLGDKITELFEANDLGELERMAEGLIRISYSDHSHTITYRNPEHDIRFTMHYDDGVNLYGLHPDFHRNAIATNYVRCYIDAVVEGFISPDLQVTLTAE